MSSPYKVINWAMQQPMTQTRKHVLLALAVYADTKTFTCHPGQARLAKDTGMGEATIRRAIADLEEAGLVSRFRRYRDDGFRNSDRYVLHVKNGPNSSDTLPVTESGKPEQHAGAIPITQSGKDSDTPRAIPITQSRHAGAIPITQFDLTDHSDRLTTRGTTRSKNYQELAADKSTADSDDTTEENMNQQPAFDGIEPEPAETEIIEDDQPTAQTLIGEWLDHRTTRPPQRVIGHLSKEIKNLLDEGYDYELVRAAVGQWHQRGLHPATLPSVLDEVQEGQNRPANASAAERRLIAGAQRDKALAESTAPQSASVDPFAAEAQQIQNQQPRQISDGGTAA